MVDIKQRLFIGLHLRFVVLLFMTIPFPACNGFFQSEGQEEETDEMHETSNNQSSRVPLYRTDELKNE